MPYSPNLLNIPSNVGSLLDSVRMATGGAQQAAKNYMPDILAQIKQLQSSNPSLMIKNAAAPSLMSGVQQQPQQLTTGQELQQGTYYSPGKGGGRIMYRPETGSQGLPWFNLLQNPALMEIVMALRKAAAT